METISQQNHGESHDNTYSTRRMDRISLDGPADFALELSGGLESDPNEENNTTVEQIVSLDPEVLASLVVQLRTNLASAVRERDEVRGERDSLMRDLAIVQTRLQELEGSQEREVEYLNEMAMWRRRCEQAEEQIGMLRGKVEESRRALMTLQTQQSRRHSQFNAPFGSPHAPNFVLDGSPRTPGYQKRISLQGGGGRTSPPVVGVSPKARSHQRGASASDQELGAALVGSQSSHVPSSFHDASASPSELDPTGLSKQASTSRRQSAMTGRPTESLLNPMGAELEALRQELVAVRIELTETKQELWESVEAREAGEVCLKALKEFIAENSIGDPNKAQITTPLSLPPLPTDHIADTEEDWSKTPVVSHPPESVSKKGWGLGFWGSPTVLSGSSPPAKTPSNDIAVSHSSAPSAPLTKSPIILAPAASISNFVSKWRSATMPSPSTNASPSPTVVPNTSSPKPYSPSYTLVSAFGWNASAPPRPPAARPNDNYTPAPPLRSIKRRPSAYSSPRSEVPTGRKSSPGALFGKEPLGMSGVEAMEKRGLEAVPQESLEAPSELSQSPEYAHRSLPDSKASPNEFHRPYLDSTPSLTDTETIATTLSLASRGIGGGRLESENSFSSPEQLVPPKESFDSVPTDIIENRDLLPPDGGGGSGEGVDGSARSTSRGGAGENEVAPPVSLRSSSPSPGAPEAA